jgi:hypothetical protein
MADAQIYKGGTVVVSYGQGEGHPNLYRPPYGKYGFDSAPPFNAHFNGAAGSVDYPGGCPFKPSELTWQRDNVRYAALGQGDILQMLQIPCNHWISLIRFDVNNADPRMAGATATITGQRVRVSTADPYNVFTTATEPLITAAVTAQGVPAIPLDVPSSTIVWLSDVSTGYAVPLYVEPEFVNDVSGVPRRHETGALLLGIRIASMPSDTSVKIEDAQNDMYMTTRVTGLACPSFT